ncbi:hypothetical protein B0H14DRAFT_2617878 [Mycena olivaceomarginata]|nr:hypothetical protein B0H14DRAFT_2617878 [Mycena olivaceomarginata]
MRGVTFPTHLTTTTQRAGNTRTTYYVGTWPLISATPARALTMTQLQKIPRLCWKSCVRITSVYLSRFGLKFFGPRLLAFLSSLFPRRRDTCKRNTRAQLLVNGFAAQIEKMTDTYLQWSLVTAEEGLGKLYTHPENTVIEDTHRIYVVDLFSAYYADVPVLVGEHYIASAYIGQGLMPAAPYLPNVAITIRTLKIFRAIQLCCPRLGVQEFIRMLCDIHGVAPRPHLGVQFSVAFNVYLSIRAEVDKRVQVTLGRDTPNWRLKNACPACLYKLEGEQLILLPVLCTFDGNNSLVRFWRREREVVDDWGRTVPGASKERIDARVAAGDYYMPCEDVNMWSKEGLEELMKGFVPGSAPDDDDDGTAVEVEYGRWEAEYGVQGGECPVTRLQVEVQCGG